MKVLLNCLSINSIAKSQALRPNFGHAYISKDTLKHLEQDTWVPDISQKQLIPDEYGRLPAHYANSEQFITEIKDLAVNSSLSTEKSIELLESHKDYDASFKKIINYLKTTQI